MADYLGKDQPDEFTRLTSWLDLGLSSASLDTRPIRDRMVVVNRSTGEGLREALIQRNRTTLYELAMHGMKVDKKRVTDALNRVLLSSVDVKNGDALIVEGMGIVTSVNSDNRTSPCVISPEGMLYGELSGVGFGSCYAANISSIQAYVDEVVPEVEGLHFATNMPLIILANAGLYETDGTLLEPYDDVLVPLLPVPYGSLEFYGTQPMHN